MKRTQYIRGVGKQGMWRIKDGVAEFYCGQHYWPAAYTASELRKDRQLTRMTREQARQLFPKAFHKGLTCMHRASPIPDIYSGISQL